jgi:hypothetical protein
MPTNTLVIFTTSPTGLGHIRVTKALLQGLPHNLPFYTLGIQDPAVEGLYRLISTNLFLREAMEFFQTNSYAEKIQTQLFSKYEQHNTKHTLQEILALLQKFPKTKNILIISTHAQLARRIQSIIDANLLPLPTKHAVVVTDDSPQMLWAVPADVIFVPSEFTRIHLSKTLPPTQNIQVTPYPIDPLFGQKLSDTQYIARKQQVDPHLKHTLHICIPISGAAVQLDFFHAVIGHYCGHPPQSPNGKFKKIHFHIVAKRSPYSHHFLSKIQSCSNVTCYIGETNESTIDLYNQLYLHKHHCPALEITKPSEQCFKVLTPPQTRGGCALLLTKPVGRQEYDNLDYLKREGFIPTRALELADTPTEAITQIDNLLSRQIFYKLISENTPALNTGVQKIWDYLHHYYN